MSARVETERALQGRREASLTKGDEVGNLEMRVRRNEENSQKGCRTQAARDAMVGRPGEAKRRDSRRSKLRGRWK